MLLVDRTLHGRVLAALLRPEERVLQHPARAAGQAVGYAVRRAQMGRGKGALASLLRLQRTTSTLTYSVLWHTP